MKRITLLICLLFFLQVSALDIHIPEKQFNTDNENKLILCNYDLSQITFDNTSIYLHVNNLKYEVLGSYSLSIGTSYSIKSDENVYFKIYFTELPIINIYTDFNISDTPKVLSKFSLSENNGNYVESNAGIEWRGGSTQSYPKKSYEIEFWDDETGETTKDISLLGMRDDKDWNLQAMYNEAFRVRSKTAFELWDDIGKLHYKDQEPKAKHSISLVYAEIFLNGKYQGVYAVGEKVDRKQLKLKKNNDTQIRGELYKGDTWGATTYSSIVPYNNNLETWAGYEYKYPKDLRDWSNIYNLTDFVINSPASQFLTEYKQRYNVDNIVDYFIFLNLLRATDNTGKNLYTAKYNTDDVYFFIPWDLDGVLGRIWNGSREDITDDKLTNGLYNRLWTDTSETGFRQMLSDRWTELRNTIITQENIIDRYSQNYNYLKNNAVYERENIIFPNSIYADGDEELDYINTWLNKRITYLDSLFYFEYMSMKDIASHKKIIYPNPAKDFVTIPIDNNDKEILIYDYAARLLKKIYPEDQKSLNLYIGDFKDGTYILNIIDNRGSSKSQKLIIKK